MNSMQIACILNKGSRRCCTTQKYTSGWCTKRKRPVVTLEWIAAAARGQSPSLRPLSCQIAVWRENFGYIRYVAVCAADWAVVSSVFIDFVSGGGERVAVCLSVWGRDTSRRCSHDWSSSAKSEEARSPPESTPCREVTRNPARQQSDYSSTNGGCENQGTPPYGRCTYIPFSGWHVLRPRFYGWF